MVYTQHCSVRRAHGRDGNSVVRVVSIALDHLYIYIKPVSIWDIGLNYQYVLYVFSLLEQSYVR